MKRSSLTIAFVFAMAALTAAQHPTARPGPSTQCPPATSCAGYPGDGVTTFVVTPQGQYPSADPFANPPGSNFLQTANSDFYDSNGSMMPNTNPSTPDNPYNLLDGPVVTSTIDPTSPKDDLITALFSIFSSALQGNKDQANIQFALNILEGNPIPTRPTYSGMALLHYTGPEKLKQVQPIVNGSGATVGGNVNIHQIWFDNHIESDTSLLDATLVANVPWEITYTIDVLHRGTDDFAPYVMYFDAPGGGPLPGFGPPNVAFDATFFPMNTEGVRYVFKVKMSPGKYFNLIYHWGWRIHPPRVQVAENANKILGGQNLYQWEVSTFGPAPRSSRATQLAAIAQIGELSPAKRMWQDLNNAQSASTWQVALLMADALLSFNDWSDRTHLPRGVTPDPNSDATLFYVNNTIYGGSPNTTAPDFPNLDTFPKWTTRPATYVATLLNGDHFVHSYMNVDFGGSRGWENEFQSTVAGGGSGCWFTFGRDNWWVNAGGPWGLINVPAVGTNGTPGLHRVNLTLNFEPSRRLKLYQFDPLHHDVAIFSLH
jgi:hypothetical protein